MTTPVIHINQSAITCVEEKDYDVKILVGAPKELVTHRELRNKYETNRSIKTWSSWFLLKRISPNSGKIAHWLKQKDIILEFLQLNENTFRRQLAEMKRLGIATVDDHYNISLAGWKKACEVLNIEFQGTETVTYNPKKKHNGKQVFRFIVTAEEFRQEQQRQLDAFTYHLDNNPLLKSDLHLLLLKEGADDKQLRNAVYFQQQLLKLQMRLFKEGSDILGYVMTRRADINRSGNLIKEHHCYKSKQSTSYLKKRMRQTGVIEIKKIIVESKVRSRLYIPTSPSPQGEGRGEAKRDGYKWIPSKQPGQGKTAWFLCDQVSFNYSITQHEPSQRKDTTRRAA